MFDHNKLEKYKETLEKLELSAIVFDQEPRLQFGYDGENYYIDEFCEELDKFVALIECFDWEEFVVEVGLESWRGNL